MTNVTRRGVLGAMAGTAVVAGLPTGTAQASGDGDRIRPHRLTTEHLTNPLGIDAKAPRFGWQLAADGIGRAQSAYRIRVATAPRAGTIVWDSGRVESRDQSAIPYAGKPLQPRTRYYWSVDVWDERGRAGEVGDQAWFETAMLSEQDWAADWIGTGIVLPEPLRVLPPRQFTGVPLEQGGTLGQSFISHGPLVALTVFLDVTGNAGCTMTLHRGDKPGGAVVARQVLSGRRPDRYGNAIGRLDLPGELEPGTYYLGLSDVSGTLAWQGLARDEYDEGMAFANGEERPDEDRWLFGLPPDPPANPVLRKEFSLPGRVASARLYLAGLGHAVAWVNGQRVGDAVLSPGATNFDQRVLYSVHDVTEQLQRGANAVGVALGRGFFSTRAPDSDGSNLAAWIAEPQLRARLEVTLEDGREVVVGSGPDWSVTDGPTTYDAVYEGETYDARRAHALNGWTRPSFDATGWAFAKVAPAPAGRLEAYAGEHMRTQKPVRARRVTRPAEGVRIFDFGKVLAGWVRLRGQLPAGARVRVLYGERLGDDGRIYVGIPGGNDNVSIGGRFQIDEYVATGRGVETWQPSFTYKGFQYVEVTGVAAPLDLVAVPVRSDVPVTMDLELEHPELQWIADAFKLTAENSIHGFPDTSPLSKVGWLGTVANAGTPYLYQFGMASVIARWFDDIALSQSPSGALPLVAPLGGPAPEFLLSPAYASVYADLVRRYWLMYGDRSVPEKHFENIRRTVEWMLSQLQDGLADDTFGDWYPPNPPPPLPPTPRGPEGGKLVGTAHVIKTVRNAAALADLVGKPALAVAWRRREAELVQRFNDAFLDKAAGVYRTDVPTPYRQTSNAIPLALDLVPAAQIPAVVEHLAADVEAKQRHLDTGSMGTGPLPFALSEHGRADLAVAVLGQKTYPGFGYWHSLGATTFWERWESNARARQDPTTSAPVTWLVERAAGVEPLSPGWARFRVAPVVDSGLPAARIRLDTVRGRVAVSWRRRGSSLVVDVEVPVNAVAEVSLPGERQRVLGSGRYRLRAALPR